MYLCSRWPSRSSDWKCLLGVVLLGAWNSTWWPDAQRQDYRRRRRFVQHIFQRDWSGKTRSSRRFRWLGTDCCWWVSTCRTELFQRRACYCLAWVEFDSCIKFGTAIARRLKLKDGENARLKNFGVATVDLRQLLADSACFAQIFVVFNHWRGA